MGRSMVTRDVIDTEETFEKYVRDIVTRATANGVDVEGAWPVVTDDPDVPDWDLEIVRLSEPGE